MLDQSTDRAYVKSGEWIQHEEGFLKAHLLPKGIMYNSANVPTRSFARKRLSDDLSETNMDRAVYTAILKHTQPCEVTGLFV